MLDAGLSNGLESRLQIKKISETRLISTTAILHINENIGTLLPISLSVCISSAGLQSPAAKKKNIVTSNQLVGDK